MSYDVATAAQGTLVSIKYKNEYSNVWKVTKKGKKSVEVAEYGSNVKIQQQIAKLLHKYRVSMSSSWYFYRFYYYLYLYLITKD